VIFCRKGRLKTAGALSGAVGVRRTTQERDNPAAAVEQVIHGLHGPLGVLDPDGSRQLGGRPPVDEYRSSLSLETLKEPLVRQPGAADDRPVHPLVFEGPEDVLLASRVLGGKPMLRPTESETVGDRDRIVNLSDGVFAIAITLLVLDIQVPDIPEKVVSSQLPEALLSLWPKYLGYFLSFVGISAFWLIHHSIFRPIRSYDRTLLYLNFLFLMVVAFVPFPTALLGEYGDHQLPVAIYAATLAVGRLLLTAIHWYSTRNDRLLDEPQDPATVRFFLRWGLTIPAIFLLSIGVSFFSVGVAIWTWLIMLVVDAVVIRRRFR
jgi:uncharacterized membrane protein